MDRKNAGLAGAMKADPECALGMIEVKLTSGTKPRSASEGLRAALIVAVAFDRSRGLEHRTANARVSATRAPGCHLKNAPIGNSSARRLNLTA